MSGCVFPNARQCTATSKRTGRRCRSAAKTGWDVCRHHGAGGGAPKGPRNGAYRHGLHTKEAVEQRARIRDLIRSAQTTLSDL